ncbi:MAG: hypothetical protein H0T73_02875, partial [Ardenticatenales bacterium]|nr:hypothetical protein [Ardenticatenales bacterium]
VNSTISDNSTQGGDVDSGRGGGIYNITGTLSLHNSTISDNVASHGGGIYNSQDGVVLLRNSIVRGNISFKDDGNNCLGRIESQGYNLLGNARQCEFIASTGDRLNTPLPYFPMTGSPGYYPLPRATAAMDAGNPAGCLDHEGRLLTVDQRGVPRQGRCDIGSYEYNENHDPFFYLLLPATVHP